MARSTLVVVLLLAFVAPGCGEEPRPNESPDPAARATSTDAARARCRTYPDCAPPPDCNRESYPGPWTACPEADWVRRISEAAGYGVVGDTGSAFVASGKGREFYIWATRNAHSANRLSPWRPLDVVNGTTVYGDEDLWRWWTAGDFIFWVKAGPRPTVAPPPQELASLIDASRQLPPPS